MMRVTALGVHEVRVAVVARADAERMLDIELIGRMNRLFAARSFGAIHAKSTDYIFIGSSALPAAVQAAIPLAQWCTACSTAT
ncbi:MAG: hypothetical protein H0U97_15350 [Gammaproteobacteria bacterium]|nr:hypothetical protein [Gammaproteobacteria bacterium]